MIYMDISNNIFLELYSNIDKYHYTMLLNFLIL